jgi:uncharacterized membrane protein YcaP (DUF421 family)
MEKEEIHLRDLQRILIGEAPVEFLVEVLIRSIIITLIFTVVARLLGKRMNAQLSQTELGVMLALGGIIGPVMQIPDRGILLGALALLCILIFQRSVTWWGFKNSKVEQITQGIETVLVKDGIIQIEQMGQERISRQQLFAVLRAQNIYNLGKVERLYLEGSGLFSIYTSDTEKPGLSALPLNLKEINEDDVRGMQELATDMCACQHCGNTVQESDSKRACSVCGDNDWVKAVC